MKKILIALVFVYGFVPLMALADAGDTRVVVMWQCMLKDGKTMDEVKANNQKWLAYARKVAGSDGINSYAMRPVIGELGGFMFVDTYPDMAAWSKVQSSSTPEGDAIDATFDELTKCTENRLYNSTQH